MEENLDDENSRKEDFKKKRHMKKGKSQKEKGAGKGKGIKPSSKVEKPRIKIRMSNEKKPDKIAGKGKKGKPRAGKQKRRFQKEEENGDEEEDEGVDGDVESSPIPRKKRAKIEDTKQTAPAVTIRRRGTKKTQSSDVKHDVSSSIYLDATVWKGERESLDGSFAAARKFFSKRGPWKLPAEIIDKFREVALATLSKMDRLVTHIHTWLACRSIFIFVLMFSFLLLNLQTRQI